MKISKTMAFVGTFALAALYFSGTASASSAQRYVPRKGGGYAQISELAGFVEKNAHLSGFRAFALAIATNESKGNNLAVNDSSGEAAAACNLYKGNAKSRFASNPFPASRFCFGSGGWYGFLPATALAGKAFRNSDPWLIFSPTASTAMLADYVWRVANGYWSKIPEEHRNLLTVRRFMLSNRTGLDWEESTQAAVRVREKFAHDLQARGFSPDVMYTRVYTNQYPGTATLYAWLQNLQEAA